MNEKPRDVCESGNDPGAFDEADHDPAAMAFRRVCTPMVKYWVCKRAPVAVTEAMEVLGGNGNGNGYVEEGPLALLYREAPLNSIWEGSGNVMCLDMLRAIDRAPDTLDVLFAELRQASGADRRLDTAIAALETEFIGRTDREHAARRLAEALGVALQASLLVRHAPAAPSVLCRPALIAAPSSRAPCLASDAAPGLTEDRQRQVSWRGRNSYMNAQAPTHGTPSCHSLPT